MAVTILIWSRRVEVVHSASPLKYAQRRARALKGHENRIRRTGLQSEGPSDRPALQLVPNLVQDNERR